MKLSNYIIDVGRPIAYYPELKKVTGSTTSSILLCQLLYWSDRIKDSRDGWIFKDSLEIEDETGLTYYEQKTARNLLVSKGLIEEEYKRLDHRIGFRVNQENLNLAWEEAIHRKSERLVVVEEVPDEPKIATPEKTEPEGMINPNTGRRTDAKVKGNIADGTFAALTAPANKKVNRLYEIKDKLQKKFHIVTEGVKWEKFINFVYDREINFNQPLDAFINWSLKNGFDPIYWTPEKMKTLYPQAFMDKEINESNDIKLPDRVEKEIAPMPKDMGRKKTLY